MDWLNEPPAWRADGDALTVRAGARTDFWRKTHYGFIRDKGHLYYQTVRGDFTAEARVHGDYAALYDQAGLMVRADETTWLKCGIEFVEGVHNLSVVVTRDVSDWSVTPLAGAPEWLWLRVERRGATVEVHYSLDGAAYSMARLAYLSEAPALQAGPMCAAPEGDGFEARFEGFRVRPA
jgi:uncharacterized protein